MSDLSSDSRYFSSPVSPQRLVLRCPGSPTTRISCFADPISTAFGFVDELFGPLKSSSESRRCLPLVVFLPLRSSRLHRLGYLSIAIHHDFHFIALLRSSTVDDIYVVGHAVSGSCLLLSLASLNYLKIFNF